MSEEKEDVRKTIWHNLFIYENKKFWCAQSSADNVEGFTVSIGMVISTRGCSCDGSLELTSIFSVPDIFCAYFSALAFSCLTLIIV